MGMKKQLGMGVMSAALGLALVGGGTYAAFNDVESTNNSFAAGTLNLDLSATGNGVETSFNLSNLKPGDEMTRMFKLSNIGSLAIKEVWMDVISANFTNGDNEFVNDHGMTDNDSLQFLDQFAVEIFRTGVEGGNLGTPFAIISKDDNVTLRDIVEGTNFPSGAELALDQNGNVDRINVAPTNTQQPEWNGLPADPRDHEIVEIKISMIDDQTKVTDANSPAYGEYTQNKYQGDSISLALEFEATQWNGIIVNENGHVKENEKANPQPENNDPVVQ